MREVTWVDGIKALIDGKVVTIIHNDGWTYTYRITSDGEFKLFNRETYTFEDQYLDASDITEGKWFLDDCNDIPTALELVEKIGIDLLPYQKFMLNEILRTAKGGK